MTTKHINKIRIQNILMRVVKEQVSMNGSKCLQWYLFIGKFRTRFLGFFHLIQLEKNIKKEKLPKTMCPGGIMRCLGQGFLAFMKVLSAWGAQGRKLVGKYHFFVFFE